MTRHGDLPSAAEPRSIDDLVADAEAVRQVLHLGRARVELSGQRILVIPADALAMVAELDSYGD